ncbi:hypothetical protein BDV25DRAFT_147474 [Aspergillus avenaceus]|uniref:DUF541 domain-containing protein n=1 Tax=Aspergillus avenaceus TaxID=36643 RepID=A0A5N6U7M4_ASPAV|nr:hypothetical protein BDV25DRAFT_147474 [Aspergillus avenaceus]
MSLKIHTVGTSTIERRAERAVISLTVSKEGPDQATVSQDVTRVSNNLQSHLGTIAPQSESDNTAAVTVWNMSSISTGSYLPWDHDKEQHKERVYTARTNFDVRFRDFSRLGEFVSQMAMESLVSVESIDWQLTDDTNKTLGQESRKLAVKDALSKARDYVDALGLTEVKPLEVDDTFTDGGRPIAMYASARGRGFGGGETLNFVPEDCKVSCSVKMTLEGH